MKIGLMSSDFRRHSVVYFVLPIVKNANGIYAYYNNTACDVYTDEVAQNTNFRNIYMKDTRDVISILMKDGIDLLIDLNGYTSGARIDVLMQFDNTVSYLGYPSRVEESKNVLISEELYTTCEYQTQKPMLLKKYFAYEPLLLDTYAPHIVSPPCLRNGYITFGSFAAAPKINQQTVSIWKSVLKAIPDSRMVIKNKAFKQAEINNMFGQYACRVDLIRMKPDLYEHLADYNKIDMCLDTLPYNGTTTTCEALWMGVPTVSIFGKSHRSRMTGYINSLLGFGFYKNQYVQTAINWSRDPLWLKEIRYEMRSKMHRSLCNGVEFTENFMEVLNAYA